MEGYLLTEEYQIMNRWKEHRRNLQPTKVELAISLEREDLEGTEEGITAKELEEVIKRIKSGKAPSKIEYGQKRLKT